MSEFNIVNESPYSSTWFGNESEKSPDDELIEDSSLIRLRQSSAKLIKNNFMAAGAQQAFINYIVGGSLVVDLTTKAHYNSTYEEILEFTKAMDLNRSEGLNQTAERLISQAFKDGDVLVNIAYDSKTKTKYQTYIELVEASRVRTRPKDTNNALVREGVEYDEEGRIKGYWVTKLNTEKRKTSFYGYKDDDYTFYPRYKKYKGVDRLVCDLFKAPLNIRANQSRQIPVLTPAMELLRYVMQYLEAVLIGARVAACFSGFVKTNNPVQARKSLSDTNKEGAKLTKLQPGTLSYLRPNEDISFASPNRPSDNFDAFLVRVSKFFSMTLRIPYAAVYLDLSDVTYSAWKGGSIEVKRNINRWRIELNNILVWVMKAYILEGKAKGYIKGSLKDINMVVRFPKFEVVDEEKTARANRLDIENNLISKRRVADEGGRDFEELQKELTEEMIIETTREAEKLKLQKELEELYGIEFNPPKETRDRGSDTSEEEKTEKRKEDGNW